MTHYFRNVTIILAYSLWMKCIMGYYGRLFVYIGIGVRVWVKFSPTDQLIVKVGIYLTQVP